MCKIINLGFYNKYSYFIKLIYANTPTVSNLLSRLFQPKFSVLNSTLFIVEDLESLLNSVTDKGFVTNQGPQK